MVWLAVPEPTSVNPAVSMIDAVPAPTVPLVKLVPRNSTVLAPATESTGAPVNVNVPPPAPGLTVMMLCPRLKVGAANVSVTEVAPPLSVKLPPTREMARLVPRRLETTVPLLSRSSVAPGFTVMAPVAPVAPDPLTANVPPETVNAPTKSVFADSKFTMPAPTCVIDEGDVDSEPDKLIVPAPAKVSACAPANVPLNVKLAPASAPMLAATANVTVPESVFAPETASSAPNELMPEPVKDSGSAVVTPAN